MTDIDVPFTDGTIPNLGYHKWYHIYVYGYGDPKNKCLGKFPLLALHGGPGECYDCIEFAKVLTSTTGWRVIFYDQIGCGNSSIPTSRPDLWTVETYVDEIIVIVCDALGLERIHLLVQSWRGVLTMEYMTKKLHGIVSLMIAGRGGGGELTVGAAPPTVNASLLKLKHEAAGTFDHPEYKDAMMAFYHRHVCIPDWFQTK